MMPFVRLLVAGRALPVTALMAACLLTACQEDSGVEPVPNVLQYASVDSLVFWPPTIRYARPNDSLSFRAMGLNFGYECSDRLLEGGWTNTQNDTGIYYRMRMPLYQHADPPGCNLLPSVDSLFKRVFIPDTGFAKLYSGKKLFLQAPGPTSTDSLVLVAGKASLYAFAHVLGLTNPVFAYGPFTIRDSTAEHPRWMVRADSLATCEILQTAVFKRSGDTLRVRVRRIQANPLPESVLPACAGQHTDSVEVVQDLYKFP